jgi:hypothetical protein
MTILDAFAAAVILGTGYLIVLSAVAWRVARHVLGARAVERAYRIRLARWTATVLGPR